MKRKQDEKKKLRRPHRGRPTARDEGAAQDEGAVREVTDAVDVDEAVSSPDADIAEADVSPADFDSSANTDESLGILQGDDLREAIAELRRLGNRNGGYVTFDEMNRLLPQDTVAKIIDLDETKSEIAWLNGLSIKEGAYARSSFGDKTVDEYEAEIKQAEALERIKTLQKKAENLQDELDEFNAATRVEIELED